MHAGRTKTYHELCERVYGITRDEVEFVLKHCKTCVQNKATTTRAPLKPITCNGLFERVQIDLIDYSSQPCGEYRYVLHIVDHFSKYSSAFALRSKTAEEVAERLALYIGMFGPPKILQCDNGGEFRGATLLLLRQYGIRVINGRARHPQSQGLVEKMNGTFKSKMRAWMLDSGSLNWVRAIPEICLSMNKQRHSTTRISPYQVVFKQQMFLERLSFEDRRTAEPLREDSSTDLGGESTAGDNCSGEITRGSRFLT